MEFVTALKAEADSNGFIPFERYMALALYHPTLGFYTKPQERVGRSAGSHFYTATSLGPVFGELVCAAAMHQLRGQDPATFRFVEIGAERGRTVLDGLAHPFASVEAIGVMDDIALSGRLIVFSNELFDAQPCARFRKHPGGWEELGVTVLADDVLAESSRPLSAIAAIDADLPPEAPEGYTLDLPRAATTLARRIAQPTWDGLFMAFDYGKSWRELTSACPQGTVRAYHHHQQSNALFAHPGHQDLTCHVCWDHLTSALDERDFEVEPVLSQEAFLVKNASQALASIMAQEAPGLSPRKSGLMQLLHPSALGQKFQVLSAWRKAG